MNDGVRPYISHLSNVRPDPVIPRLDDRCEVILLKIQAQWLTA